MTSSEQLVVHAPSLGDFGIQCLNTPTELVRLLASDTVIVPAGQRCEPGDHQRIRCRTVGLIGHRPSSSGNVAADGCSIAHAMMESISSSGFPVSCPELRSTSAMVLSVSSPAATKRARPRASRRIVGWRCPTPAWRIRTAALVSAANA